MMNKTTQRRSCPRGGRMAVESVTECGRNTHPGIGENTTATLLAFISPFERFCSAKQLVAYAGLNPRIRQSAQWAGKSPIAKTGNVLLRKALYMPALTAKRYNAVIMAFCSRLLARGKRPCR